MDKTSSSIPGMQQEFDDVFTFTHPPGIYRYNNKSSNRAHPRMTPQKHQDEDFLEINSLISQKLVENTLEQDEPDIEEPITNGPDDLQSYFAQNAINQSHLPAFTVDTGQGSQFVMPISEFSPYGFEPPGIGNNVFFMSDEMRNQDAWSDKVFNNRYSQEPIISSEPVSEDPSFTNNPYAKLKSKKELEEEKKKKLAAQNQRKPSAKKEESKSPNVSQPHKTDNVHYNTKRDKREPYPTFHGTYNSPYKPHYNRNNYYEDRGENNSYRKSLGSSGEQSKPNEKTKISSEKPIPQFEDSKIKDDKKKDNKETKEVKETKENKDIKESESKTEISKEEKIASLKSLDNDNKKEKSQKVPSPDRQELSTPLNLDTPDQEKDEQQTQSTQEFITQEKKKKKKNKIAKEDPIKKEIETLAENKFMPLIKDTPPEIPEKKKEPEPAPVKSDIIRANESISDLAFSTAQDKKNKKKKKKEEQKRLAAERQAQKQAKGSEKHESEGVPEAEPENETETVEKPVETQQPSAQKIEVPKPTEIKKETPKPVEQKSTETKKGGKDAKQEKKASETKVETEPVVPEPEKKDTNATNLSNPVNVSRSDAIFESISTNETTIENLSKKAKKKKKKKLAAAASGVEGNQEEAPQQQKDEEENILEDQNGQVEDNGKPEIQLSKSKKKKLKKKAKQQTLHEAIDRAEKEIESFEQEYFPYFQNNFNEMTQSLFADYKAFAMHEDLDNNLRIGSVPNFNRYANSDDEKNKLTVQFHIRDGFEDGEDIKIPTKKKKTKKKNSINLISEHFIDNNFEYQPNFWNYPPGGYSFGSTSTDELGFLGRKAEFNRSEANELYSNLISADLESLEDLPVYKLIEQIERQSLED